MSASRAAITSTVGPAVEARAGSGVELRLLRGEAGEMRELQRVLEAAPDYAERVSGAPPGAADAQSMYGVLPPDKGYEDKFVFGIHAGDSMVGCVDLIRGWPRPDTALIGLLLVAEDRRRQGIGRWAFGWIVEFVRGFAECRRLRIGVVASNEQVLPFWTGLGFAPTGERRPYRNGRIESTVDVLERDL